MTVRSDVLAFLKDPRVFAATAEDGPIWLKGLEFAEKSIEENGDRALRAAQRTAWIGLAAQRAALILGPPGTGKTHLLSWLIAGYAKARTDADLTARTFVTAFTKNAVGNVLDAVVARQVKHDPAAPRVIYYGSPPTGDLSPLIEIYESGQEKAVAERLRSGRVVIGGTIWSLNRLLRSGLAVGTDGPTAPIFDLVCIDEASQMVLGQSLMALAGLAPGGRVVVAGDNQQLPPVRAARTILIEGREMGGSLYGFLKSTQVAEFPLQETFRLNKPLAAFPEKKFYPGRYESADPTARLALRENWRDGLDAIGSAALDPAFPIVILLHDGPSASTSNPFEATLAANLASALAERVVDASGAGLDLKAFWTQSVAVISPHRAQNAAIRTALPNNLQKGAFVETVDRIQGKERDAVILSYCVADAEFALAEGDFIFSPERLNVATTRARTKLVVLISRRLLDAAPTDQDLMDKAEVLREFVFSCEARGVLTVEGTTGRRISVQVLARGFPDDETKLLVEDVPEVVPPPQIMTPLLDGILEAIRTIALNDRYQSAVLSKVRRAMALPAEPVAEARILHDLGWISLYQRPSVHGPFWTAVPYQEARRVYPCDLETLRLRIAGVIRDARGGRHALYYKVRDRFSWVSPAGSDQLLPLIQTLAAEGLIKLGTVGEQITVEMATATEGPVQAETLEPIERLLDEDFVLLNRLETIEASRINFGVFEGWTAIIDLARHARRSADDAALMLSRLEAAGHVLLGEGGNVRSRMAEIAREVRYSKQRFRSDDATRRPYLVRNLKVELRDRKKPVRDRPLNEVFADALAEATVHQRTALVGFELALRRLWPKNPALAAFQARGLKQGLSAWRGDTTPSLAIAADTGSGKTEAAILPMLVGALADQLEGIRGVRAILAYPRVRLATNQAQRLAGYLAACSEVPELPALTLGLQVGDVPNSFKDMAARYREAWKPSGPDAFAFPFFNCPKCGQSLVLRPDQGDDGADALVCTTSDWRFGGWIGSKAKLAAQPPSLFLPTTDSLHQWLHNPAYGSLFGDDKRFSPPRALLADEIHLYTHIHGAQVGLTLRRLAARAQINDANAKPMVAVGMSATIGDPALSWGRLIGRDDVATIQPSADETDLNPRGREIFYFIQPEVESRGSDIAGASTTIQSLMCIAHGMRRRTGDEGGFRSLVFFDSIDKMRRLHGAYVDAEMGKELASLRTSAFGDDARGQPQDKCCGQPEGCDRFNDGECWWFAANDRRQRGASGLSAIGAPLKVARSPISSASGGDAESLVKGADIVFATSSLEVGYDDPDITLVYQHYAPQNLASFVQRKGRGGRGIDDRPTTAVTLSIYSPRDSWWFRRPIEMVSPQNFTAPLNPENAFVQRGQALSALLDGLSRIVAQGGQAFTLDGSARPEALEIAGNLVEQALGPNVWARLKLRDVQAFWAMASAGSADGRLGFRRLREGLPWAPGALFDTINLPAVAVEGPDVMAGQREDISLALSIIAPGNATRRYNPTVVHWCPPSQGLAPWLTMDDYSHTERLTLDERFEDLLGRLPREAHGDLANAHLELCRPSRITLKRVGWMAGAYWNAEAGYNSTSSPPISPLTAVNAAVRHDSSGRLRGFLLVETDPNKGVYLDASGIPAISSARLYAGHGAQSDTAGLTVSQVYWGADIEVRFDDRELEPVGLSQIFSDPNTGRPLLHGYQVETEGLQIKVNSAKLDRMAADVLADLEKDSAQKIWLQSQYIRYLVSTGLRGLGINSYDAQTGASLIATAKSDSETAAGLRQLRRFWSDKRLIDLFEDVRTRRLAQNPTMTQKRVQRAANAMSSVKVRDVVDDALSKTEDGESLGKYVRSVVLHSLVIRLKQSVRHIGQGDDRRLLSHVRLPLQFDEFDDVITLCEAGAHGDGTIRAVGQAWNEAVTHWTNGFLADCPNAEEDAALSRFWAMSARHPEWRRMDPRDTEALLRIGAEISPEAPVGPPPSTAVRILYGVEFVGAETFALYDLALEIEAARATNLSRLGRPLLDWEIASAAISAANDGTAPTLERLRVAYDALVTTAEESFTSEARLADQVFRLAVPLCFDGCRACVHQASDVIDDTVLETTVSRRLLNRFLCDGI